jgi:hypothetical protein
LPDVVDKGAVAAASVQQVELTTLISTPQSFAKIYNRKEAFSPMGFCLYCLIFSK